MSAGEYSKYINSFQNNPEEIQLIISNSLESLYSSSEIIMSIELDVDEYISTEISAYHPNTPSLTTSMHEDWIWINFDTVENLLHSGIHIDTMKFLQGLIFEDYDAEKYLSLQESLTRQNLILNMNDLSDKLTLQGDFSTYSVIISLITTILGTIAYLTYLSSVIKNRFKDYFVHYFWAKAKHTSLYESSYFYL